MQVLRYRHDNRKNGKMLGYPDGDLGRIKTQQKSLKAMIERLMSLKTSPRSMVYRGFNENVETDLSFQNMLCSSTGIPENFMMAQAGYRPGEL